MQGVTFYLLVSLIIVSKFEVTKCNACNQLIMEKLDSISSHVRNPDSALVTQIITLTSKIATVESQFKVEQQETRDELQKTKADLQITMGDLQATKAEVASLRARDSNPGSSSFVRWGRKSCPGNTTLVYSGVAGGKHFNEKGSGTNRLCLSRQPEFDDNVKPSHWGHLFGAEYQYFAGRHDHDVPCSVCRVPLSSTIMVPGTRTCPPAWTTQYHGHLASEYHLVHFATEYVCLDQQPENESSGVFNQDGNLFYYTKTVCGSLPCPPYVNDKIVTCVVCSK